MKLRHKTMLSAEAGSGSALNLLELAFGGEAQPVGEPGLVWEFLILRAGPVEALDPQAELPFYFTKEFIREIAPKFEGWHCYADHQPAIVGSIRNVVGFWKNVRVVNEGQEAYAQLHLFEAEKDLRQKIESAWKAGRPDLIGASVKCIVVGTGKGRVIEGKRYSAPTGIDSTLPRSIDLVPVGAVSGAGLVRLVAANSREEILLNSRQQTGGTNKKEEHPMTWKQLIALMLTSIRGWAADRAAALERELATMPEDDSNKLEKVTSVYVECMNGQFARWNASAGEGVLAEFAAQRKAAETVVAEAKKALTDLQAAQQQVALNQCATMLQASLADSKLPAKAQAEIARRFANREFSAEELTKEIAAVRELCAAMVPEGRVLHPFSTLDSADKLQIALDKAFGLTTDDKGAALPTDIPAFRGLREAYIQFTGDTEITGRPDRTRLSAILNNAGFPNALANTLNRALLKEYRQVDYRAADIVSSETSPTDFKTQERVRTGFFPDIATVDPEAADFAEIAAITDEKVSYSVGQKGNILTVTRKAIMNDDLGALMRLVGKLGRAAKRTLARAIWSKFTSNATYDVTGLAWFHATHNNLSTAPLSVPALNAAALLMYNQTEKDSNEILGLDCWTLAIPRALWEVAFAINNTEKYATGPGIFEANPWFKKFGQNNERIIVNPLQTDVNDWGLFANPADVDILEVGYLQGKKEPEFFLADAVPAEQVFVADKIRYKIRHEYGVEILDFRGAHKAVVP